MHNLNNNFFDKELNWCDGYQFAGLRLPNKFASVTKNGRRLFTYFICPQDSGKFALKAIEFNRFCLTNKLRHKIFNTINEAKLYAYTHYKKIMTIL